MERIKKGDTVEVKVGKDAAAARREGRNVRGTVHRVIRGYKIDRRHASRPRSQKDRVVVQGVNLIIKHQRRTGDVRTQFGRIEMEAPIHLECDVGLPVLQRGNPGWISAQSGSKIRYCKRCDEASIESGIRWGTPYRVQLRHSRTARFGARISEFELKAGS